VTRSTTQAIVESVSELRLFGWPGQHERNYAATQAPPGPKV
jgi:hypothetical protein